MVKDYDPGVPGKALAIVSVMAAVVVNVALICKFPAETIVAS